MNEIILDMAVDRILIQHINTNCDILQSFLLKALILIKIYVKKMYTKNSRFQKVSSCLNTKNQKELPTATYV